jgi:hypothetical protein
VGNFFDCEATASWWYQTDGWPINLTVRACLQSTPSSKTVTPLSSAMFRLLPFEQLMVMARCSLSRAVRFGNNYGSRFQSLHSPNTTPLFMGLASSPCIPQILSPYLFMGLIVSPLVAPYVTLSLEDPWHDIVRQSPESTVRRQATCHHRRCGRLHR